MSPTLTTVEMVGMSELMLVGFNGKFEAYLTHYSRYGSSFHFRQFDNSFVAYRWLERCKRNNHPERLPKAIVYNLDFLKEEDFRLLQNVRNHPSFNAIPFIVINLGNETKNQELLKAGIDDCYNIPVDYEALEERIGFLQSYKKEMIQVELEEEKEVPFKSSFLKRTFDILAASAALLLLSPILLLIALAIKMESKGSPIYRSKRVGTGYNVFNFYKFRSMYKDADKRLKEFQHLNQYNGKQEPMNNPGLFVKFNNDPRVTKVGKFIRKTSLDELPQLFNILKGDMSLVGNRPLPLYEAEQLTKDEWAGRFLGPAGLTGLWQVTKRGKGDMSAEERINLDITYAQNHSFMYDLKIIWKTIPAIIQEENV